MLTITFFTSNATKLAHARYLAEKLPIKINGFRERTYHASYNEPRLDSRDELLRESYESAVVQSKKAHIFSRQHFFILEDTSVRIEALSAEGVDVPGLDVKYWMKDATFASLERAIVNAGGNRAATVRSDIVLHIPKIYKDRWGIKDDYLVFTGKQEGTIVEEEQKFETNVVYPWLDNKTFNKWFKPTSASEPLGKLPIAEAEKYDFRKKSFDKLFAFLQEKGLLDRELFQEAFSFPDQVNYILCGYTCAGKTTASQHLANEFDYLHVEASDFMQHNFRLRHGVRSHGALSIGDFAEQALKEKPEIAAEGIVAYLKSDIGARVVISGYRSLAEVNWTLSRLEEMGKRFRVVFIEAPEEQRFERMKARSRSGDVHDLSRFRTRDDQQRRMGLDNIRDDAKTIPWSNIGSVEDLKSIIDAEVVRLPHAVSSIDEMLTKVRSIPRVKLEDAILVALLTKWDNDETREYFTTSEIAKLANQVVGPNLKKHKDNVSRYFNQNYYVYYEISPAEGKVSRKYRLSNTGYGRALRTLRDLVGRWVEG
ncbi:non-canonical purine NTP pyrophosphatase [Rhizobium leguminosarum]|uniref:non-canonical purine NTP pyrophosphatase n=1 Tax=Rhizobium leguminosarum TaxID=384 RepID=UPI003F952F6E